MKYKTIETEDGSISLYSYEYQEAMHSISGAYEEALLKHVYPSRVLELNEERILVLDIGFGIGYNILALLNEFLRKDSGQFLQIISLENDLSHISIMESINFNDDRDYIYEKIKLASKSLDLTSERYSIKIIIGDARLSLKKLNVTNINIIFHDPYSPSKNPELWTPEFFKELGKVIDKNAILTTYSSALQIRMALLDAGFRVGAGPSVGMKREGTLATISGNIKTLNNEDIEDLRKNPGSTPYRDFELRDSRDTILERRIKEMKERRGANYTHSP